MKAEEEGPAQNRIIATSNRTFAVAIALLIGFTAFIAYMLRQASHESEVQWSRLVFIFGAAEAITFAAVGWIFGSEVHRGRAEAAEIQARSANEAASVAVTESVRAHERGSALAAAVRSHIGPSESDINAGEEQLAGEAYAGLRTRSLLALRRLSEELFPTRES